jgi:hypothetical protein
MNLSLSWIDPEALAAALAKADLRPPATQATEPGGLTLLRALAAPTPCQPEPSPPPRAAMQPTVESASEAFRMPEGTMNERLDAFLSWAERQTRARQLFVFDADGLALVEHNAEPFLVAMASSFVNLLERLNSCLTDMSSESLTIDLDKDQALHVLRARTRFGLFALGAVVDAPVPRPKLSALRVALKQILEWRAPADSVKELPER